MIQYFFRSTADGQQIFYLGFGQCRRFRLIFFLFNDLVQIFVDAHNGFIITGISESFRDQFLKGLFLSFGRQRCLTTEDFFHQSGLQYLRVAGIVEHAVKIGVAVIECGKQKAGIRCLYDPAAFPVFNIIFLSIVAETCLVQLDRADTAHEIFIYIIGSIEHLHAVLCFFRNVIGRVNQDDIVVFPVSIIFNDLFIKFFQKDLVLELAVTKFQKPGLCSVRHFLSNGKFHIQKIFAHRSRQSFFENLIIFEDFFFGKRQKCFF